MRRTPLIFLLALFSTLPLFATDAPPATKYRIERLGEVDSTDLKKVTVRFRVVDETGGPAKNLPDEEFLILEDGVVVHRFRPAGLRAQPVSTVLAMDTSGSMERQNRMQEAKRRPCASSTGSTSARRAGCSSSIMNPGTWSRLPRTSAACASCRSDPARRRDCLPQRRL